MDEKDLHSLLKDIPRMSGKQRGESESVLEELQAAIKDQERILARQAELIARLRKELRDVEK